VRDACDLGYLVTVPTDACVTLSAERHDWSLRNNRGYCRQITTAALLGDCPSDGSPMTPAIRTGAGDGTLLARDAGAIADIGRLRFSPLCVIGGHGSRLTEEGGRTLLDLSASWGAASLGYGHAGLTEAVNRACADMAGARGCVLTQRKCGGAG
jgi:hypothetical protein